MPLTKHQIFHQLDNIMCQFASSFVDESQLLSIVWHLSQKCYGCKLILKINDEKRKITIHESSMRICNEWQFDVFKMFIKTMNTVAVMLLDDIKNDLLDISNTQTLVADSPDSD